MDRSKIVFLLFIVSKKNVFRILSHSLNNEDIELVCTCVFGHCCLFVLTKQRNKTLNICVLLSKGTTICTGLMIICCKDLIVYAIAIHHSHDGFYKLSISINTVRLHLSAELQIPTANLIDGSQGYQNKFTKTKPLV